MTAYDDPVRKHTTIDLDQDLVREAAAALGTVRTTDTVHAALSAVVRRRRREGIFEVSVDLDLDGLDELRAHRFADRTVSYSSQPAEPPTEGPTGSGG